MKKESGLVVLLLLFIGFLPAQIVTPVKWTWTATQTAKGTYKLTFTAKIDGKWHTYSQYIGDGGPVPTKFTFDAKNKDVQLVGKTTETGPKIHEGHDPVFDMQLKYFEQSMTCEQTVKVLKDTKLKGTLEFMACDDSKCLPPDDIEFEFDLKAGGTGVKVAWDTTSKSQVNPGSNVKPNSAEVPAANAGQKSFDSAVQAAIQTSITKDSANQNNAGSAVASAKRFGTPISNCGMEEKKDQSIWMIIVLGFLGGLVALVTPCVFPMIPLTVSFFTKRSESKTKGRSEAFFYSFCIVLIYFLLTVPFLIFNISPDSLNEFSTGAPLNVFFFVIFLVFAFSFFGFYEITLPSFIANKADSASNIGGLAGIFFMALTLAIVSFSCTGPIIGSLLVGALSSASGKLHLVAGMTSFGLALALPFGLFALFPGMMKSLPKSGGWLNSVKVVLGFVELIFAIKFLSNADLVAHWGILKRELFLGLWALMGAGLFFYIIGLLKFPHDSGISKFSPVRIVAAALALVFTGYSAYGIFGNDLHFFSGFPPPKFYSYSVKKAAIEPIKNDYEAALAKAKAEHKPLMIDFTGWACVNCRKMEENIWTDVEVQKRLADKYVIVSLYVDDKRELPENEQYKSEFFHGKQIKTLGNKFSEMEAKYFDRNTQPYYVLVSPDEKLLTHPSDYTPTATAYVQFLDCGLNAFKQLSQK
ncbi:MAG: Thiol:disulfide interchange protein DsbD precursor [Bacteroidota bacterium]|nr:Thiol:disulfide interchange protein DsbD precursor [Bacteroidota bacterium]